MSFFINGQTITRKFSSTSISSANETDFERGVRMHREGNNIGALTEFTKVIKKDSTNHQAYENSRANSYFYSEYF
ncbi:MAG: hypothetical protein COA97_07175 [Flavobacteriales bacterium]|nr:MAG: hypothetical protein COA97_07175 [Flavobacteriales bacterium]